jgi:hypothetical protein
MYPNFLEKNGWIAPAKKGNQQATANGKKAEGVAGAPGSIPDAARAALRAFYRPFNAALYEYLGVDLGWDDAAAAPLEPAVAAAAVKAAAATTRAASASPVP